MELPIELNDVQFAVFWQLAAKKLNYKVDMAHATSANDDPNTGAFINHWYNDGAFFVIAFIPSPYADRWRDSLQKDAEEYAPDYGCKTYGSCVITEVDIQNEIDRLIPPWNEIREISQVEFKAFHDNELAKPLPDVFCMHFDCQSELTGKSVAQLIQERLRMEAGPEYCRKRTLRKLEEDKGPAPEEA